MAIEISAWLGSLGLGKYAELFAEQEIDFEIAKDLADAELEKMGVPLGPRKKLLKALGDLKEEPASGPTRESRTRDLFSVTALAASAPTPSATIEGERRQLTVLFCDMAGFTELASRLDPEVLQTIIRSYEDACAVCITRYEGYVFQRLGDGIVAFFGYPLAHEGEAERAIHAGLAILESLAKLAVPEAGHLRVRIGIATGLVVVSSAEKGAVGETMNLASRLQGIAPLDSIVVSERVWRLAGGVFTYEDLGAQNLKGIGNPAQAFRVLEASQIASRFEAATRAGLTALVGREQEIGLLLERWQISRDGEGQVVLLSGEPGIGKSRVLSTMKEQTEAQGAQTLSFQCSPYHTHSAFWPSIDNFERALRFARDDTADAKLNKLEALVVTQYGRPKEDVRFLAAMLSIPADARYGAITMTPQRFKDETLRALVDFIEALARKQPTVMLFEDAHWTDPTSLEVLDLLIDRVKGFPLLIVITHRPEFQSRWSSHSHVTALNLSKLTKAQGSAMVNKVARNKALPGNLLERILGRTDGIPLFVEEFTKAVLESKEIRELADRFEYTGTGSAITIPDTLRDSLMARLDRSPPVKEIAQIGAAIGREFSYDLIQALAPKSKAQLDQALQQLTDSGLAFRRGTPPEATYSFKHALLRDAAYESMLVARRRALHAQLLGELERTSGLLPEILAHHAQEAGLVTTAVRYWKQAGEQAAQGSANLEAIAHLRKAIALIKTLPQTPESFKVELRLQTLIASPLMASEGYAAPSPVAAIARAHELATQLNDHALLFPLLYGRWAERSVTADHLGAVNLAQDFVRLADGQAETGPAFIGHRLLGTSFFVHGEPTEARRELEHALSLYAPDQHRQLGFQFGQDPRTAGLAHLSVVLWQLGYPDQAVAVADESITYARGLNHANSLAHALFFAGVVTQHCLGQIGQARRYAEELGVFAEERQMAMWLAFAGAYHGGSRNGQDIPEGIAQIRKSLVDLSVTRTKFHIPFFLALQAAAHRACGATEDGLRVLEEALKLVDLHKEFWMDAEIYRMQGDLRLDTKGILPKSEAEASFRKAIDIARHRQMKSWELRATTSLARLWQSQDKLREARELIAPIYNWFTEGFDTKDLKEAEALLEELGS